MKLNEEIDRISKLMNINLINEGIDDIIKKLLGVSDESTQTILKGNSDELGQYSSSLKSIVGGSGKGTISDIVSFLSKEGLGSTDDAIATWIKSQPEIMSQIARSSDNIMKQASQIVFGKLKLANIFDQESIDAINELLTISLNKNRVDTIIKEIDDVLSTLRGLRGRGSNTNIEDLIKQFEDRKRLIQNYKSSINSPVNIKQIDNSDPQSYLDNLSKEELEGKLGSYSWKNIGYNQDLMSGWKFHVFGEDVKDAVFLQDVLKPVIDKYRCSAKIGGTGQISSDAFKPGQVQYGKQGATIYIPPDVINSGRQQEMLSDIKNALSGYKKGGTISGDQALTPSIHYRYELLGPAPKEGIDLSTYRNMYSPNQDGGVYKPNDVEDLFSIKPTNTNKVISNTTENLLKGNRISNRSFGDSDIDWSKVTNAKNMNDYNKLISQAIQTGNYQSISRGGFEKFGIANFRDYLMNNISTVNELDPNIGRWSVTFK
jgi:hypothetical protein